MLFQSKCYYIKIQFYYQFIGFPIFLLSEKVKRSWWCYDISFYHFLNVIFNLFFFFNTSSITTFFPLDCLIVFLLPFFFLLKFLVGQRRKKKAIMWKWSHSVFHFSLWEQNLKLQSFAWTNNSSCCKWLLLLSPSPCVILPLISRIIFFFWNRIEILHRMHHLSRPGEKLLVTRCQYLMVRRRHGAGRGSPQKVA